MPRPLYLIFIAALANVALTMGSMQAQTLPRVGQVLWDFNNGTNSGSGGIAYAEDAGLVFGGTYNERLFVLDASTGEVRDTINMLDWGAGSATDPFGAPVDISCSRDGSVLCLLVASVNGYKVVIMEYPSKRILKDSVTVGRDFAGSHDAWKLMRVQVSPMGRYVVTHDQTKSMSVPGRYQLRLYDLLQDTSYLIDGRSWARCDFDDAERQMVFLSSGSIGTALCGNRVSIATLGNGAPVIKHTQEYGWPAISGDGRFVMSSGYGVAMDLSPYPVAEPRARIVEIETGNVIWSLDGDFSGGDIGSGYSDFGIPAWSKDASRLFCARDSKSLPADWRARIFYTTNDTVPTHRIADTCMYHGSRWSVSRGSTNNSQLTIGFSNGGGIRAERLVPTTSSVDDDRGQAELTSVYPNPTNAMSTIQYTLEKSGRVIVDVIDIHGAVVITLEDDHADAGTHTVDLSSASITSGTYVVRVRQGSMMYTSLVVVRH
ncbi:MAG TPA: T9SS type A sorting domain-containing protein [Candidatus Didemnitutus sp.]|nr:T9SS type A sorting domain-containing protein [Candidatus Didemnitutus sp.]